MIWRASGRPRQNYPLMKTIIQISCLEQQLINQLNMSQDNQLTNTRHKLNQ